MLIPTAPLEKIAVSRKQILYNSNHNSPVGIPLFLTQTSCTRFRRLQPGISEDGGQFGYGSIRREGVLSELRDIIFEGCSAGSNRTVAREERNLELFLTWKGGGIYGCRPSKGDQPSEGLEKDNAKTQEKAILCREEREGRLLTFIP
jgi:hypothetical protein